METTAKCPVFGQCGGCSAQHIPYEAQLENKKQFVERLIKKSGIEIENAVIGVFSDKPYGYRNRMDFIVHQNGLGFRQKGDWKKVIDIENCPISNNQLNILLKEVREFFNQNKDRLKVFDIFKHTGTLRYAVIRTPDFSEDSSISFVLNVDNIDNTTLDLLKEFSQKCSAKNVVFAYVPKNTDNSISEEYAVIKRSETKFQASQKSEDFLGGNDFLKEKFCGYDFYYDIQGFFQNNSAMADKMLQYVRGLFESCNLQKEKSLLVDLYGGVGTFGIISSPRFSEVLTIESYKKSTEKAEMNIKENKIQNVKAVCQDAMSLKKIELEKWSRGKDLYVLTDPPRSGMHKKAIQYLLEIKPKSIIYVSCNPQQLSVELEKFKGDYKTKSIAMFDLFPQTPHIETVVELVRK
ncbi:MAG: 23S rRNA (uracil(1939)-C(5))-methyltransferase RlmD [Nanoarchaeota archaeon]|nr:23S rRNA (uracil(1939)-C(5))-methyltransferase RlmD [Nanoarchaeota archaeon]